MTEFVRKVLRRAQEVVTRSPHEHHSNAVSHFSFFS